MLRSGDRGEYHHLRDGFDGREFQKLPFTKKKNPHTTDLSCEGCGRLLGCIPSTPPCLVSKPTTLMHRSAIGRYDHKDCRHVVEERL